MAVTGCRNENAHPLLGMPFRLLAAAVLSVGLLHAPAVADENITVTHGISTFGDLKYGPDFPHLDYVNPDAPKGGEWSGWGFGGFDSVNPYTTKGRAVGLSSIYFESMLTGTADEVDAEYGLLAETLEYPESRDWVIFNMRPEARFSDGTPLTAEDAVFSFELLKEKGLPSFRVTLAKQVEAAEVLDTHRVKFTFTDEAPRRSAIQLVGGLPVFSKKFYEETGADFEDSTLTPATGSGPYVLDSINVPRQVVYRRNPDYWGADLPINIGRNNFDTIRLEYFADYTAAFEGFKGGAYTFRNEASSLQWATGYDFPAIDNGYVIKRTFPDGVHATGQSFAMNLRRPQFQDVRVREALGMMFNFEWSNETLFYGIYSRTVSYWDNSDLKATGMPSEAELALLEPLRGKIPDKVFTEEAFVPPVQGARQIDRRMRRAAAGLLEEAGWVAGNDGLVRNADGETLTIEILNDSQTFDRVINPFVENLRSIGVDARHVKIDNAQLTLRERSHDFDMLVDNFRMSLRPSTELEQYFGSETADVSVFNATGLASEGVDALIEHVKAAEDLESLTTAVHALDRTLRAYKMWIPQWHKPEHTVAYYDIFGFPENLPPYSLGQLDFWWYDQEKADRLEAAGAL